MYIEPLIGWLITSLYYRFLHTDNWYSLVGGIGKLLSKLYRLMPTQMASPSEKVWHQMIERTFSPGRNSIRPMTFLNGITGKGGPEKGGGFRPELRDSSSHPNAPSPYQDVVAGVGYENRMNMHEGRAPKSIVSKFPNYLPLGSTAPFSLSPVTEFHFVNSKRIQHS